VKQANVYDYGPRKQLSYAEDGDDGFYSSGYFNQVKNDHNGGFKTPTKNGFIESDNDFLCDSNLGQNKSSKKYKVK